MKSIFKTGFIQLRHIAAACVLVLLLALPMNYSVGAANLCVEPSGAGGCHTTIQAAINAANAGDTIHISAGTYNENVVVNKNNLTLTGALALNPNDTPDDTIHTIINGGAPAVITSPGISIPNGVTGVTIQNLRVQGFASNSGIYGAANNNNLTIDSVHVYSNNTNNATNGGGIYMNGPVSNVSINNVDSQFNRARGIVIWNGFKQNISITNSYVANNNCCGIELQDGTASGVTLSGNTVVNNFDSGMSAIGLTSGAGANVISNNTVTDNGRYGIEIKLPNGNGADSGDGSIVVENNTVSLPNPGADLRDFAGIAVFRRSYLVGAGYVDIPTGVIVRNNTVSGYRQNNVGSNSTGFGIVVEGTNMLVEGNTLTNNDVGIQVQAGHLPYTANTNIDGDQSNLDDDYFGRGNSPIACARVTSDNVYNTNGVDARTVGANAGSAAAVFNETAGSYHCSIQQAIDSADPGDTIRVPAGTYVEELMIDKALTLLGPNDTVNPNTGTRGAEAVLHPATTGADPSICTVMAYLTASNVTIKGFTFDGDNPALTGGAMIGAADVDACEIIASYEGIGNVVIENNILEHSTYSGIDMYNYVVTDATSGNYIRYNLFRNIGETTYNWGLGVLIYNNFYADITDNVFDNVRIGIQTGNFSKANPGATGSISNNEINAWRMGIFHNLWYSNASVIPVAGNTVNALDRAGIPSWNGIMISSFQQTLNTLVTDNTITIGAISQNPANGYVVWNTPTSAALTISGGTVTGGTYGVWVNNFEGYNGNAANTSIIVDGVTITGATGAGVYVLDSPSNTNNSTVYAEIKNSVISNSGAGIWVAGSDASAKANLNEIFDNTAGVTNTSGTVMDAENNWWGSDHGPEDASGTVEMPFDPEPAVSDMLNAEPAGQLGNPVSDDVDYHPWTMNNAPVITEGASANVLMSKNGFPDKFDLTLNATDAEGHTLTWSIATQATNGTATASGTGGTMVVGYTPNLNYSGADSFVVRVTDALGAFDELTVNVTVSAGGDFPTFADVPMSGFGWSQIEAVYHAGITGGCGTDPLVYCPNQAVTRAQMAVFLLRGIHGDDYTPPLATGTVFNDVPANAFAAAWIEALVDQGITGGCGNGNYCPNQAVTRAQMAVFLLRAKYGASHTPPEATGTEFGDVPIDGFAARWIEQLVAEGITSGCGGGNYCPGQAVTRAQMAVFLQRIFDLIRP